MAERDTESVSMKAFEAKGFLLHYIIYSQHSTATKIICEVVCGGLGEEAEAESVREDLNELETGSIGRKRERKGVLLHILYAVAEYNRFIWRN